MLFLARALFVCAALVVSLHAEQPQPTPVVKAAAVPRTKPKRLRWLRRICSAEVGLAMKLSSAGIERSQATMAAVR